MPNFRAIHYENETNSFDFNLDSPFVFQIDFFLYLTVDPLIEFNAKFSDTIFCSFLTSISTAAIVLNSLSSRLLVLYSLKMPSTNCA